MTENLHNVKLLVSYDGTNYNGFQSQDHKNTIEDKLRHAIGIITKRADEDVKLVTAGRTDTGVHAAGQVVNFAIANNMQPQNWILGLNSLLPDDIRIVDAEFAAADFNARKSALYREYVYRLDNNKFISALNNRYAAHIYKCKLDADKLNEYCKYFIGEKDWTSFCAAGDMNITKVRTIFKAYFTKCDDNKYEFTIIGNAFLQHQVRIVVGTIVDMFTKNIQPEQLLEIIEAKNRDKAGKTFPSKGLTLKKIYYTDELHLL